MGANVVKSVAFVVPIACLAFLMAMGEPSEDETCPGSLAFEKSRQLVEERPDVVDVAWSDFRWIADCRFSIAGYADINTDKGLDRKDFQLVVAFDPKLHRWQQVSFSTSQ
ncbi:hypothetical protein [Neorhizobium galegae]|jgi:hypothetical protein|uniref:Uncharacterized protein n=2 Tax=Neorhizobium galegae TaxID=399 RepID=A0A068SWB7_NEOGA|nr:hypothetical protein [Neorhizobium galegae]KAB1089115.1 hypothetical protein F4V91_23855 [Neorhizobium galegae]MCQ1851844.1 hypothetical protein [Neorhizobium galegae]CDN50503.1 Hypothetical protein RG540_CH43610 [Neorhizobium galegae bv. orientalis str. HAMBI 540]CDZ48702.1 Hypothetical protein NGAL_HAMBI2427_27960 [Neorhizobium galegae bv. orientalis]